MLYKASSYVKSGIYIFTDVKIFQFKTPFQCNHVKKADHTTITYKKISLLNFKNSHNHNIYFVGRY